MCEWTDCGLLAAPDSYQPDTLDLNRDIMAANYWFPCFRELVGKFAVQAIASQHDDSSAPERAEAYRRSYLEKLTEYRERAAVSPVSKQAILGVRELLELSDSGLRLYGFNDPWQWQKQRENEAALALLGRRLAQLDGIASERQRWTELVRGVLAGNMFDWGAQAVTKILENNKDFGLDAALDRIEKRPWLMDSLDDWLLRMEGPAHRCAIIFVDNSGVDIVLGVLPFARELLRRGTKVLLCANTEPSLNDVTYRELVEVVKAGACHCKYLAAAWYNKKLLVYHNGQRGPCLDMRRLPRSLCEAIQTHCVDLLVIEGMGRALHTNLYARFCCETLKLAVIKNKWLAQHLGGDTFAVMCKYEAGS